MKHFLGFLLFFACPLISSAQVTPYHYAVPAAVSSELIYCAAQDNYGRLLLGTDKGMYRYTGFKSTRIAMTGNSSREIGLIYTHGSMIFATNRTGQLFRMEADVLKAVDLKEFAGEIKSISVSGKTIVLTGPKFITTYALPDFEFIEKRTIPFTDEEGTSANSVVRFQNKHYAVLSSNELVELEEGSSRTIPNSTGRFIVAFNGQLVTIPNHAGKEPVFSFMNGAFRNWGSLLPKSSARVTNARVIGNQLFVMTADGIFVYTGALSKRPAHWFAGVSTTDIFNDKLGNLWVCTKGKGMLFIPSGRHDIVFPGSLLSIEAGPDNTFFGGNLDGSISRFDFRGKILKNYISPVSSQEALFLHYDAYGKLIFSNTGVFSIFTGAAINAINESVKSVARDASGGIYLAKSSGIVYIPKTKKTEAIYGLEDSTLFSVMRSEPGRSVIVHPKLQDVAMITVDGVFYKKSGGAAEEVLYLEKPIDAQSIVWFGEDLIVATALNEILVVNAGKVVKNVDLSANIGDLIILKMVATSEFVYLLTEKGMYRFTDFDKKIENLKKLNGFEGLVMRDFTVMNDFLYVATQRGVLRFVWKEESNVDFTLVVNDLYGRKYRSIKKKKRKVVFPANEHMIIVPFECVDLSGNQHFVVQYAVRSGAEGRVWNTLPASAEQLSLSHLGAGDYSIELRMVDPVTGAASPVQVKEFRLLGHWYYRPILWWLTGILLALIIGWTWRYTLIRQKKRLTSAR